MKSYDEQVLIEELWRTILDMIEGSTISLDELEAVLNAIVRRVQDMAGTRGGGPPSMGTS